MIDQATFTNMLRSMFNIDGYQLPEMSKPEQATFITDPAHFFMAASDEHQDLIFKQIAKRQKAVPFLKQLEDMWHSVAGTISYHHADDSGKEWGSASALKPLLLELEGQIKARGGEKPHGQYLLGHGFRIEWEEAA